MNEAPAPSSESSPPALPPGQGGTPLPKLEKKAKKPFGKNRIVTLANGAKIPFAELEKLSLEDLARVHWRNEWFKTARPNQNPPDGDWTIWGVVSGRGWGKTLTAAQWMAWQCAWKPNTIGHVIAPTLNDTKHVCFEGPTGLLKVLPEEIVKDYNKSSMLITLDNGSTIRGFSAEEPNRLRGPQCAVAWCFPAGTLVMLPDGSERPIEAMRVGDTVATRHGPRRVTAAGISPNLSPLVRIAFGETSLTATEDHPILVNGGWCVAGDVEEGDLVWQPFNTAEKVGGAEKTGITSAKAKSICTAAYGATILAKSQPICASITRTIIRQTTTLRILQLCLKAITIATTSLAGKTVKTTNAKVRQVLKSFGKNFSRKFNRAINAATNLKQKVLAKLENFAAAIVLNNGAIANLFLSKELVLCAALNTQPQKRFSFIVQDNAIRNPLQRGTNNGSFCLKLNAKRAVKALSLNVSTPNFAHDLALLNIMVPVKTVERLERREPVYNLTVEGEHEFIANGIVVHNCDELAAWQDADETWDMMMMGLRLGPHPQVMFTTTPRPVEIMRRLLQDKGVQITRGSTYENRANLPESFFKQIQQYEGTQLGRQELLGELIDPEESGIVKRGWFKLWPAKRNLPRFQWVVLSLDTAFTEATIDRKTGNADYTACSVWGVFDHEGRNNIMLLDAWQERLGMPDLIAKVKKELKKSYGDPDAPLIKPLFGPQQTLMAGRAPDIVLIEDKGSGISLRQMLDREGIRAYAYNPGRASKIQRLHMVSHIFANKMVWLVESDKNPGRPRNWAEPLLAQLCSFAGEGSLKHDDFVDCTTQAIRLLADKRFLEVVPKDRLPQILPPLKPRTNPYAA